MVHMDELNLTWQIHVDRPLYSLNLPYLQGLMLATDIAELASIYVDEMRSVQSEGPWQVTAAGFGALIAVEMARLLRSNGEALLELTVIDPPAAATPLPAESDAVHGQAATKPLYFARIGILQRVLCGFYSKLNGNTPMFLRPAWNELRMQRATLGCRLPELSSVLLSESTLTVLSSTTATTEYWNSAAKVIESPYKGNEELAEALNRLWQ
jgi:hypothetical protein